ncbi:MAG TPA: dialkylresorcinol condensing enzyme [Desulfobacterales bacterium]|nr:dialkylresorcinol condensing enzyme [Desulfobacterales bacterium]
MKKVLVLYYSQSGQLKSVMDEIVAPLSRCDNVQCDYLKIEPETVYPYPWPFYAFFNVFPEAVYLDGCPVKPLETEEDYDLIILGYTSWFLSPSIPITGFLQSGQAEKLFKNKPVVTVIACRDMWLMAQEKMKKLLAGLGAHLVDNVVLTDQGKSLYTFVTTPRWMLTGKKDAFWFFPRAGVHKEEISASSRFGERLCNALQHDEERSNLPLLKNMGAVNVNGKLIATEHIAHRSFLIWSKLIKKAGPQYSKGRNVVITIYAFFLLTLVLTVVPLNMLIRKLISPFRKKALDKAVRYYEQPSGR